MRHFIAAAALVLAAACYPVADENPPRIPDAPEVVVTATDLRFSRGDITLPTTAVNITLRNDGDTAHDITVPALGIRVVAAPGRSVTAGYRDLKPGRYDGHCSMFGHAEAGMRLSVTVR